jgi:hypothetical protein
MKHKLFLQSDDISESLNKTDVDVSFSDVETESKCKSDSQGINVKQSLHIIQHYRSNYSTSQNSSEETKT